MKFRFIKKTDHPAKTYQGKTVSTGDVVEFNSWFSEKAMKNPNYERVLTSVKKKSRKKRKKVIRRA